MGSPMTSQGSAHARSQGAVERGNLLLVRAAAAELGELSLEDALRVVLLIADQEPHLYERAAIRWLGRLCLERPMVGFGDVGQALDALPALSSAAGRELLAELCARHGLEEAASRLR